MQDMISFEVSTEEFTRLKTELRNTGADHSYFLLRVIRDLKPVQGKVTLTFTPDQFNALKIALAQHIAKVVEKSLDLVFERGEPQLLELMAKYRKEQEEAMKANAAAQTGLGDLKEVTQKDVQKAKAKAKVRVKANSRKVG